MGDASTGGLIDDLLMPTYYSGVLQRSSPKNYVMHPNKGDQNYAVPPEVDLEKYGAVTIWCRRFGVNFATAPLTPQKKI